VAEWLTLLLIFGRSQVQNKAQRPAILNEVFHGFSQSLQVNAEIVRKTKPLLLPSKLFPFPHSFFTLSFNAA
jgi:hypothetical protein